MPTLLANPILFPPFVTQHTVRFADSETALFEAGLVTERLPGDANDAQRKRHTERVAGRYCARDALRRHAAALAETTIARGEDGEPRWPVGIVGTIAHTDRIASAAVADASRVSALGLDLEAWMSIEAASHVRDLVATSQELAAARESTGWSEEHATTLLFSAKETVFKCLFPRTRADVAFRDVWIVALDRAQGFVAQLRRDLSPSCRAGRTFTGRYALDDAYIWTALTVEAI